MPREILHWLRVKEASASISWRYLLWAKTQCSCCVSLVPRFCHREPKVSHSLGCSFLYRRETMHESVGVLTCERHIPLWIWQKPLNVTRSIFTYWELVPRHSCTLPSDLRSLGSVDLTKHPPVPRNPFKHSLQLSTEIAYNFLSCLTGKGNISVWRLEWISVEKRHAVSSWGEDTH